MHELAISAPLLLLSVFGELSIGVVLVFFVHHVWVVLQLKLIYSHVRKLLVQFGELGGDC